jgi:hypothetical protein
MQCARTATREERLDELVGGNDLVRPQREHGEKHPLALAADGYASAVGDDVQRTQNPDEIGRALTHAVDYRPLSSPMRHFQSRVQITGEVLHVVVPGTGTILLIAGRAEFDAEGNATFHGRNDGPRVCAALG